MQADHCDESGEPLCRLQFRQLCVRCEKREERMKDEEKEEKRKEEMKRKEEKRKEEQEKANDDDEADFVQYLKTVYTSKFIIYINYLI